MTPATRYRTLLAAARAYADAPPCACPECVHEERDRHAEQPTDRDWLALSDELAESLDDEELNRTARNEYARLSREAYRIAGCVMNGTPID